MCFPTESMTGNFVMMNPIFANMKYDTEEENTISQKCSKIKRISFSETVSIVLIPSCRETPKKEQKQSRRRKDTNNYSFQQQHHSQYFPAPAYLLNYNKSDKLLLQRARQDHHSEQDKKQIQDAPESLQDLFDETKEKQENKSMDNCSTTSTINDMFDMFHWSKSSPLKGGEKKRMTPANKLANPESLEDYFDAMEEKQKGQQQQSLENDDDSSNVKDMFDVFIRSRSSPLKHKEKKKMPSASYVADCSNDDDNNNHTKYKKRECSSLPPCRGRRLSSSQEKRESRSKSVQSLKNTQRRSRSSSTQKRRSERSKQDALRTGLSKLYSESPPVKGSSEPLLTHL